MPRAIQRDRDTDTQNATLHTLAMLGLAASVLFLALVVVAWWPTPESSTDGEAAPATGSSEPASEVLGETVEQDPDLESVVSDEGAFFTYAENPADAVAGSSTVITRGDVQLTVAGTPEDGRAVIRATVENGSDDTLVFPEGLRVVVFLDLDGLPYKTVQPADHSVGEVGPGERVSVTTEVPLDEFGEYTLSGEVGFVRA